MYFEKVVAKQQQEKEVPDQDAEKAPSPEEAKTKERMEVMQELREKYQNEHPNVAVEKGTMARKTELEGVISDLRDRIGQIDGGKSDFGSKEDVAKQLDAAEAAARENEDILNTKLSLMEPDDVEAIKNMDQRRRDIGQEKIQNDSIIHGQDVEDMNVKGDAARRNIALEKEEGSLYSKRGEMFDQKYKGLGLI